MGVADPTAPTTRELAWKNRRTIAAVVGVLLALVCPLLPLQFRAPCAAVATLARTWQVNGTELP